MCCVFDDFIGLWQVCCLLLGIREAEINVAEGKKQARILSSEAYQREQVNQAQGLCLIILLYCYQFAAGILYNLSLAETALHNL